MSDWNDWYYKNRDGFNESRRAEYEADSTRREKAKEQARAYRARRKAGLTVSREMTRVLLGAAVAVFSSGAIADEMGCSRQMLVNWEKRGWLPQSLFKDKHRLYTANQVSLIHKLAAKVKAAKRAGNRNLDKRIAGTVEQVHSQWSG